MHATGDADLPIVQTAIQSGRSVLTVLVGDDKDLLVLLCYHAEMDAYDLFCKPEPKHMSTKSRVWDIKRPSLRWVPLCVQIVCSCTHFLDVT